VFIRINSEVPVILIEFNCCEENIRLVFNYWNKLWSSLLTGTVLVKSDPVQWVESVVLIRIVS